MLKLLLYATAALGIGAIGLYSSHRISAARSEKEKEKQKRALFDAAIRREDFVLFRELLQRFIKTDPRDENGNTPFMLACQHGNLEVIRYYLSMHPPSSDIQKSPLFLAANDNGHTAVHVAAFSGSVETMRALLGSNSLLALAMVSISSVGSRKTPLHLAVENGLTAMVEALIKLRADVNAIDVDGVTSLMIATRLGNIALVERLLTANADINIVDVWKHSALFYACKRQDIDIVRLLLEKKKSAAASPVVKAIPRKNRPSPISRSPSSTSTSPSIPPTSPTATMIPDIVNIADRFGYTPLLLAAELGNNTLINLLIENGAESAKTTKDGQSILHLGTKSGFLEVAENILKLPNVDIHLSDARGMTALHHAAAMHRLDLLQLFQKHPSITASSFSLIDNLARTPLHYACIYERPPYEPSGVRTPPTISKDEYILEIVKSLVSWGNPTDTTDAHNETPVDIAQKHGLDSIVAFIRIHNAAKADQRTGESSGPDLIVGSLSNLRVPLDVRLGALRGNVSLAGIAAILEEGAWRVKNNFDRANPFSVVVVIGQRAASANLLKEINSLIGTEPLREETLNKTKLPSTAVHTLLLQLESLGILRRVVTLNVDAMDSSAIGVSNSAELRGSVRPPFTAPQSPHPSLGPSPLVSTPSGGINPQHLLPRCHRCREPFGDPEIYWNLVETSEFVRCKRRGCVSGYVLPGISFDDEEIEKMGPTFWNVIEEDLPACNMVLFIGTSIEPNTAVDVIANSMLPETPRLLIDTQLSGPFTSASNPVEDSSLRGGDIVRNRSIEQGGNYRDVAILFPETDGGISRGVKELARACKWGWDWDMGTESAVKLKLE
ncbi:hypothetical protein HDU97_010408 [Phlyctochytrium planicorne]|nr:hypothetical protein HDU97_010408 [Phlyctochytrium planicorne]